MAACWRALAARGDIDVHVVYPEQLWGEVNPFLSDSMLLDGLSSERFACDYRDVHRWLVRAISATQPHVVVLCGWLYKPYWRAMNAGELKRVPVVVGMDSPWRGTMVQRLGRFRLARLVKRLALAVTSGERSSEYASRIGVPANRIRSGLYGFDHASFCAVADARPNDSLEWPRQFLFVGRYVPQKGLAVLMEAYSLYRASVATPWGLTCCGTGIDAGLLNNVPGVVDAGFTPPRELPRVFSNHSAFVLPSTFEPWGVVLAEAAASGLPIVCTTACGAGVDLVRPYYNGLVVAPQDVTGLARAMRWIHDHQAELSVMGSRSGGFAAAYSAEAWASRWHNYLMDVVDEATPDVALTVDLDRHALETPAES
jgi:glycosyltransferase involved in cell wall biosynthesis